MGYPVGQQKALGVANSTSSAKFVTMNYVAALATQKFFVAPMQLRVTDITGVTRVAGSGGACTLAFYKVPSGTAVASGTLLHSGTFNMVGTADTNQQLTLVGNNASLTLNEGDSLGYVLTGTATDALGSITVTLEPTS